MREEFPKSGQYHLAVAGGSSRCQLPIADFPLANLKYRNDESAIGNWKSAMTGPTRYREVGLTSSLQMH